MSNGHKCKKCGATIPRHITRLATRPRPIVVRTFTGNGWCCPRCKAPVRPAGPV